MESLNTMPDFLAPLSADHFFVEHWGRKRLAIHRGVADYFRDVVDLRELDRLVTSVRIPVANFNLAQGDLPLPFPSYCTGGTFVDKTRALTLHQQGATVILRSVEQWSPAINRLRITAEEFFRCEAQVNVYLTPPTEKSTPPHWDTHDLIVLQIEGSKRWRLYSGVRTLPLADERFRIGEDSVSSDFEEVVLHAGDTLYLPRGVIHEPVADTYSAHLSIGLQTFRWFDLLEVALQLLASREGSPLRETWPARPTAQEPTRMPDPTWIDQVLDPEVLQRAAEILRARFTQARAVDLEGRLLESQRGAQLNSMERYARREGFSWSTSESDAGVRVTIGGQTVTVPPALRGAVSYILAHESFTPADLPAAEPSSSVALCLALHEIGALRTVPSGPAE